MKFWTTVAICLALVGALTAAAAVAPVAEAQDRSWDPIVQVLGGGGRIGVSVRDVNADEAKKASLPSPAGVVIEDVSEDSPAETAGFKEGDIVVEFDGERVRSARQFTRLVQETPSERQVQAVVIRDGQRVTLSVAPRAATSFSFDFDDHGNEPRRAPRPPRAPAPPGPPSMDIFPRIEGFFSSSGRLGISVETLSDQLAEYFAAKHGVLVTSVSTDSPAAKAGLKAGDVITSINGTAVTSMSGLSRQVQRLDDGEAFTLEVVRDKKATTLKGTMERPEPRRRTVRTIV